MCLSYLLRKNPQQVFFFSACCLPLHPLNQFVLRHHHALADLDRRKAFRMHESVGVGPRDPKHLRYLISAERDRQLFHRCVVRHIFILLSRVYFLSGVLGASPNKPAPDMAPSSASGICPDRCVACGEWPKPGFVAANPLLVKIMPHTSCACCSRCDACQDGAGHCDITMRCLSRQCHAGRRLIQIPICPSAVKYVAQIFGLIKPRQDVAAQVSDLLGFLFQLVMHITNIHLVQLQETPVHL